jgi:RHS repeat-associated protein
MFYVFAIDDNVGDNLMHQNSGAPLTNLYDATGLRRFDGTDSYIWDQQNVLQVRTASTGAKYYQFTNSPGNWGGLVSAYEPSFGSSQFYAFDQSGNTRVATHKPGDVTSTVDYTAFGTEYYLTGGSNLPFRFGGRWGYYTPRVPIWILYIQQRWLDVALAQWVSRDLTGYGGGEWRIYGYVGNGPVSRRDPSGEGSCLKLADLPRDIAKAIAKCLQKSGYPKTDTEKLKECIKDSVSDKSCELVATWFVCEYQYGKTDPCEDPDASKCDVPCYTCCAFKDSVCLLCSKSLTDTDKCYVNLQRCQCPCEYLPSV